MNPDTGVEPSIDVVLCWHMHQPDYRLKGVYQKPWTLLHALKDYTDMAAHLETVDGARAVVNFSPVLIEQIQDYPRRIQTLLETGESSGDFLLDALYDPASVDERQLLEQLLRVNEERVMPRFPAYARLFQSAKTSLANASEPVRRDTGDLLTWYFIAWMGESLRQDPFLVGLVEKAAGFSTSEHHKLLVFIAEVAGEIIPRYRRLAENGIAELSITPYSHPILPLLLDFGSALDAMPGAPLPKEQYPGGEARCGWHLSESRRVFSEAFGAPPAGCWPSEGSISAETLSLLGQHEFRWTASGSQVLDNSLGLFEAPQPPYPQLSPWRLNDEQAPTCFFRDDGMSDLIGFQYSGWPAEKAVADFISHIGERLQASRQSGRPAPVLSIIMDGENAWEYYHENGWEFLQKLYEGLAAHPEIRLSTFSDVLDRSKPAILPAVCAGSWVYGTFSTWIGSPAKNRAWDILVRAKRAVDAALEPYRDSERPAWLGDVLRQLAVCEASDWFWWLREDNQTVDEAAFDQLFRDQLAELYRMIGLPPPDALFEPIGGQRGGEGSGTGPTGTMRRSGN